MICHSERSEESQNEKILRFTQNDTLILDFEHFFSYF